MRILEILIGRQQPSSKETAKDRLKVVLVHDRVDMTPAMMDKLKDELIEVLSRHLDIDSEGVTISLGEGNQRGRLLAEIPVLPKTRPRGRNLAV